MEGACRRAGARAVSGSHRHGAEAPLVPVGEAAPACQGGGRRPPGQSTGLARRRAAAGDPGTTRQSERGEGLSVFIAPDGGPVSDMDPDAFAKPHREWIETRRVRRARGRAARQHCLRGAQRRSRGAGGASSAGAARSSAVPPRRTAPVSVSPSAPSSAAARRWRWIFRPQRRGLHRASGRGCAFRPRREPDGKLNADRRPVQVAVRWARDCAPPSPCWPGPAWWRVYGRGCMGHRPPGDGRGARLRARPAPRPCGVVRASRRRRRHHLAAGECAASPYGLGHNPASCGIRSLPCGRSMTPAAPVD